MKLLSVLIVGGTIMGSVKGAPGCTKFEKFSGDNTLPNAVKTMAAYNGNVIAATGSDNKIQEIKEKTITERTVAVQGLTKVMQLAYAGSRIAAVVEVSSAKNGYVFESLSKLTADANPVTDMTTISKVDGKNNFAYFGGVKGNKATISVRKEKEAGTPATLEGGAQVTCLDVPDTTAVSLAMTDTNAFFGKTDSSFEKGGAAKVGPCASSTSGMYVGTSTGIVKSTDKFKTTKDVNTKFTGAHALYAKDSIVIGVKHDSSSSEITYSTNGGVKFETLAIPEKTDHVQMSAFDDKTNKLYVVTASKKVYVSTCESSVDKTTTSTETTSSGAFTRSVFSLSVIIAALVSFLTM